MRTHSQIVCIKLLEQREGREERGEEGEEGGGGRERRGERKGGRLGREERGRITKCGKPPSCGSAIFLTFISLTDSCWSASASALRAGRSSLLEKSVPQRYPFNDHHH